MLRAIFTALQSRACSVGCCNTNGNDDDGAKGLSTKLPSVVPNLAGADLSAPSLWHIAAQRSLAQRFPVGVGGYSQVTLVDGQWGNRFQGWVSHQGRYIAGLSSGWKTIDSGEAIITLERTRNANEIADSASIPPRMGTLCQRRSRRQPPRL